jgi:diguanylate cyclase (GGDEF)-like protein
MPEAVLVNRPTTSPKSKSHRPIARAALAAPLVRPLERHLAPAPRGASLDAVTGLLNRFGLERALTALLEAGDAKRGFGAMLCVDLGGPDILENLACSAGAAAVEDLLQHAARILKHSVRGADAVGRLGGDDFVVVLEGLGDLANASRIAETMLFALRQLPLQGVPGLAPRIGVTRLPASARAIASMFSARELALSGA